MPDAAEFARMSPMHNKWQRATNETWPANPRSIKEQPRIAVRARVVWDEDGEEWVEGHAIRWTQHHVLVSISDPRCHTIGFWLAPADVKRKPPTSD
jgi:hypothetical protein